MNTDLIPLQDDTSEIDIEFVSKGSSIVNNTINYTSHPSMNAGRPIFNASRSVRMPKDDFLATYREHRFDCSPQGVEYFLDGRLEHADAHSIPQAGGSLQLNLWSDGNRYWSGSASTTDVFMHVRDILVYYNTTGSNDKKWLDACVSSGGPEKAICVSQSAFTAYPRGCHLVFTLLSASFPSLGVWVPREYALR
jgi:hypothetical protein